MKFTVVTLFPQIIEALSSQGVLGQACHKGLVKVETLNPRLFTSDLHKTVDDRPFGGGDGMILLEAPLEKALEHVLADAPAKPWVVYLSPQGTTLNQGKVEDLAKKENLVLVCGRYGGIDQRFLNRWIDEEISIGDYILSGGELAAGVVIDSVARQIPGVLGHSESSLSDSFSAQFQGFLEGPSYTRPRESSQGIVPEILLSGNHAKIAQWRRFVSILTTLLKRPDLIAKAEIPKKEWEQVRNFWKGLGPSDKEVLGLSALSDSALEHSHSNGK